MNITLKIAGLLLDDVRRDLSRRHPFAYERVGFLLAAAAEVPGGMILFAEKYLAVEDDDYERSRTVGAQIGSDAMRKAVQAAFRPKRALLHIHMHGGKGKPGFSGVDLRSADDFVPAFGQSIPSMPHGLLVLSDDDATAQIWLPDQARPAPVNKFVRIGPSYHQKWTKNKNG